MKNRRLWGLCLLICLAAGCARADDAVVLADYVVQTAGGKLNIRAEASLQGEIIGWLYQGDAVQATGYQDGWTEVLASIEAGRGWVKSEYLAMPGTETGKYQNTSGGRVRLRDGVDGDEIGWVLAGAVVEVTTWATAADGEMWAYVGNGYVMGKYISKAE